MLFVKKLIFILCLCLFISFLFIEPAYSRGGGGGGCFSAGTLILTPEGNKPIEQLRSGDRVVNYNSLTHNRDIGTISKVETIKSPDYYLINHHTKVTGTHPFYLKTKKEVKLIKVKNLHQGDVLIDLDNFSKTIFSIKHIYKPIAVYNLISINPNYNFYADGFLVHNKGGGGDGGSFGRGGSGEYAVINEKTFPGFLIALTILISGMFCIVFWRQIYNYIAYAGKNFTEDEELIKFTAKINSSFKNKYSVWYTKDDQVWQQIPPKAEVAESKYKHILSKAELIEKVFNLFIQYQNDWTTKNFSSMTDYINKYFYEKQRGIFKSNFGNNFDIVYDCRLSQIVPIDIKLEEYQYFFRVQINGEMMNFKLSFTGYIISGKPYHRAFSEYWDIKFTLTNKCYLVNIEQVEVENLLS